MIPPTAIQRALILLITSLLVTNTESAAQTVEVRDIGLDTQYQDTTLGHHKRGRANVAADFNLDGYVDFYMGNPSDESLVLRAVPEQSGQIRYEMEQVLVAGPLAWSGTSLDYDNDGDYDIFIGCGGNEGIGLDYLFRNDWIKDGQPTGFLTFTDVTDEAGIAGPVPNGAPNPVKTSSAGVIAVDYDRDGNVDVFVSGNDKPVPNFPELSGRNTLWRNNGDGTFTDVSVSSGLGVILSSTRHSTFFDFNNDGYMDLFENNYHYANRLWRNNGDGTFADVTLEMSAPGHDLSFPNGSFASAAADFNNDGWEDLIVWMRGSDNDGGRRGSSGDCGCAGCPSIPQQERGLLSPYDDGHAIFINQNGMEFENVAPSTIINEMYVSDNRLGVMGCQVGDINGDGFPDVYIGNGGPTLGHGDQLFISNGVSDGIPVFTNSTSLIDFPADIPPGMPVPAYPYRTHGVTILDMDNDGTNELLVSEGGPSVQPDDVREPNRLFKFGFSYNSLKIRLIGDGFAVSRDATGSHIAVTASNSQGESWTVHRTLYGGSAFSAHNGFDVLFGLGEAESIESVEVVWPDGSRRTITEDLILNSTLTIEYLLTTDVNSPDPAQFSPSLRQNFPNPFNPSTTISYVLGENSWVSVKIYNTVGQEMATLVENFQAAGNQSVVWNGRDDLGRSVASGIYIYRLEAGDFVETKKLLLLR